MSDSAKELKAMTAAYVALKDLDSEQLPRALGWLTDALGVPNAWPPNLPNAPVTPAAGVTPPPAAGGSAAPNTMTPKEFIASKKPKNGAERIACLAYYLSEVRGTPHFKAPDIVALNTEAAQSKIGNPSRDVDNAERGSGYLASAGGGNKQLSTRGEALVVALPDRDAVAQALHDHPVRRRAKKAAAKKSSSTKKAASKKSAKKGLPKP